MVMLKFSVILYFSLVDELALTLSACNWVSVDTRVLGLGLSDHNIVLTNDNNCGGSDTVFVYS